MINRLFKRLRYALILEMPRAPIPVTAALLLAAVPGAAPAQDGQAELTIRQVVIRVPRMSGQVSMTALSPIVWTEKKGPKCLALGTLAGALITQSDAVDLVSVGGGRVRAHLDDDCPALDFYSGFYLRPTKDGKVCAGRDAVRSRAGRKCGIDHFRKLVAKH